MEEKEIKALAQQYENNIQTKLNDWMGNCLSKDQVNLSTTRRQICAENICCFYVRDGNDELS